MSRSARKLKKEQKKLNKRHQCFKCSAAFAFPNKLRSHIRSFHSLFHMCEYCGSRFDRFNQLRTHVAVAHHVVHQCHLCSYSSNVKSELRKHILINHEKGVRCTISGCFATVSFFRLKRHIEEAHLNSPLLPHNNLFNFGIGGSASPSREESENCGESEPSTLGSADMDVERIDGEQTCVVPHAQSTRRSEKKKKFTCKQTDCNRSFSSKSKLHDHVLTHKGLLVAMCNSCGKEFKSRAYFAVHLRRYHQTTIRDLKCHRDSFTVLSNEFYLSSDRTLSKDQFDLGSLDIVSETEA